MSTSKIILLSLVGVIFLSIFFFTCNIFGIAAGHVTKSLQDAVINYDNYQETYNTCQKLNTDLGIMEATPDSDKQFDQFSKSQRLNALKMQLNRWVEDYNAKSKEIDKNLWKSSTLPYQLSVNDFSNYK